MRIAAAAFAAAVALNYAAPARSQARLIEAVDLVQTDAHIDVLVQFTCALRYVGHDPSSQGALLRIRLRLSADCGAAGGVSERVSSPDPTIVQSITLEELFAPELALTVRWGGEEKFVLAPAADLTGLRIRLLRSGVKTRVYINEDPDAGAQYSINLDSALTAHDDAAIAQARERLRAEPYESLVTLNGVRWFRLRVGPFATRAEAERVLIAARAHYPRAWLAIGDEAQSSSAVATSDVQPTRSRAGAPLLSDAERALLLEDARKAMQSRRHSEAITLLTQLVEQPEYPQRAQALELLGLARERSRQLAHAKAEYEEYLRLYAPTREADRVRQRLRALVTAVRRGPDGRIVLADQAASPWRTSGGVGMRYQRDSNSIETDTEDMSFTAQNSVISDFDAVARRRGERFDFLGRTSFGHQKDLLHDGPGDRTRVSAAYAELSDKRLGLSARLGRQSRGAGGLPGALDALVLGYQATSLLRVNAIYGHPIESSYDGVASERTLVGLSMDVGPLAQHWDVSLYAFEQEADGLEERRVAGAEIRYLQRGRSVVGLIDYEFGYQELNSAIVVGTFELPARWSASINVDHRASPLLSTRNALIGQPFADLDELGALFDEDELRQLAEDRTATADAYSLSLSRPLNERVQLSVDVAGGRTSGTPASAGVAAIEPTDVLATSVQLLGGGWLRANDFNLVGLRYQTTDDSTLASAAWYTRWPLGAAWRLGPRLRINQQEFDSDGSEFFSYAGSLRLELLGGRSFAVLEAGAEIGARDRPGAREDATRYYFSAEYRWTF